MFVAADSSRTGFAEDPFCFLRSSSSFLAIFPAFAPQYGEEFCLASLRAVSHFRCIRKNLRTSFQTQTKRASPSTTQLRYRSGRNAMMLRGRSTTTLKNKESGNKRKKRVSSRPMTTRTMRVTASNPLRHLPHRQSRPRTRSWRTVTATTPRRSHLLWCSARRMTTLHRWFPAVTRSGPPGRSQSSFFYGLGKVVDAIKSALCIGSCTCVLLGVVLYYLIRAGVVELKVYDVPIGSATTTSTTTTTTTASSLLPPNNGVYMSGAEHATTGTGTSSPNTFSGTAAPT